MKHRATQNAILPAGPGPHENGSRRLDVVCQQCRQQGLGAGLAIGCLTAFVKWIASEGGQAVLRDGTSFEYAVGTGDASNAALPPLGAPKVDPASLDSKKVTELMTAAGLI